MSSILLKQIVKDVERDERIHKETERRLNCYIKAITAMRMCFAGCDGSSRDHLNEKILDALVISGNVFDKDMWPNYVKGSFLVDDK